MELSGDSDPHLWPSSWHFVAISDQMECLAFEADSIRGLVPCQHRILALLRAAADTLAALKDACLAVTFRLTWTSRLEEPQMVTMAQPCHGAAGCLTVYGISALPEAV